MAVENEREIKKGLQVREKTNTLLRDNNKQYWRQRSLPVKDLASKALNVKDVSLVGFAGRDFLKEWMN